MRSRTVSPRRRRTRRPESALAALALALAGCGDLRERPLPTAANSPVELFAQVVTPTGRNNTTVLAGRSVTVLVRAGERSGRLEGTGFIAQRFGGPGNLIDADSVAFPATADTTLRFTLTVPQDLPHNAQLNLFAIAIGPKGQRSTSIPETLIVLRCTPGAAWC